MLNISNNPIPTDALNHYPLFQQCAAQKKHGIIYWLFAFFVLFVIILFLPWTQNVRAKGKLTTLSPDHRPQSICSTLSGRIEKWYVREGDFIQKGDTVAFISEVKSEYFDPQLVSRTGEQVAAKSSAALSYQDKANALTQQATALTESRELKISQTRNKIKQNQLKIISDSTDYIASQLDYNIAEFQYRRTDTLYQKGIKSLTDLEEKRRKQQETQAKMVGYQNKLLVTRNELINAQIELNAIVADYADKIAKSNSDRFTTISDLYEAEGAVAKLKSQYTNYGIRAGFYYIVAPQDCFISKIYKQGLGEIIKEGEELISIMPSDFKDIAVEMYIKPMDFPLIAKEQRVMFIFDGFPAFVFSGWENQSVGTFKGRITAVDNMASPNGLYRVLISPDSSYKKWPEALRVGSAAEGIIMLNDVSIWYEVWRQLNGFPPDFYDEPSLNSLKLKPAANSLKK
jgi:membrane fusion protein, adhesin transport system